MRLHCPGRACQAIAIANSGPDRPSSAPLRCMELDSGGGAAASPLMRERPGPDPRWRTPAARPERASRRY
jgi:hypothetical protein